MKEDNGARHEVDGHLLLLSPDAGSLLPRDFPTSDAQIRVTTSGAPFPLP